MSKAKPRPIYLVGPMGVGKSTVGRLLAKRLGRAFFDSDHEIESRAGRSIAQIFVSDGEAFFRRLEADTIDSIPTDSAVIALGGGALSTPATLEKLLDRGDLVYLKTSVDVLIERIRDPSSRPLLAGLDASAQREKLTSLLEERGPTYESSSHIVDASGNAEDVVMRIVKKIDDLDESSTSRT